MNIKHTILMITYNQEDYIKETLECLFRQGVLPYEVFIADDYSTDNTRKIILEYKDKYPNIIKPIFHKANLGIYKNLNYIINNVKVNGDIISFLSGDDLYKDNMLLTFDNFIEENSLNPLDEKFLLLSTVVNLSPNGKEVEILNNYEFKNKNHLELIKLRLRDKINSRCTGISRLLFDEMDEWNLELGLWADYLNSVDLYIKCNKFYFINKSFPIYRLGSGVTTTKKKEIFSKSWIKVANYIMQNRKEYLDTDDIIYLKKTVAKSKVELENSLKNKIEFVIYYTLSFKDVLYGYSSLKEYLFQSSVFFPKSVKTVVKKLLGI